MPDAHDPLDFIKNMWGNMGFPLPGMVTPTLDTDELDKRISELKTVEGWLKTNLGLLQMTIQGLEMQRATLAAMRAMSEPMSGEAAANPFANAALWQWPFMPAPESAPQEAPVEAPAPKPEAAAQPAAKPEKAPAKTPRPRKKRQ